MAFENVDIESSFWGRTIQKNKSHQEKFNHQKKLTINKINQNRKEGRKGGRRGREREREGEEGRKEGKVERKHRS